VQNGGWEGGGRVTREIENSGDLWAL